MKGQITKTRKIITCGPWGAWSPPSPKSWYDLGISTQTRTRTCTETTQTRKFNRTCRFVYTARGLGVDWISTYTPLGLWTTTATKTWTETETKRSWFDPPKSLFGWESVVAPPVFRGDQLRVETEWLRSIPEVRSFNVTFDGEAYKHNRWIRTDRLSPGSHAFHFDVQMRDLTRRRYQVSFSLVSKVSIAFVNPHPQITVDSRLLRGKISGKQRIINGGKFPFYVINNTPHEMHLAVEVIDAPEGWIADIVEKRIFSLRGNSRRKLTLRTELMNDYGICRGLYAPFTVGCATYIRESKGMWTVANASFGSLNVFIKVDSALQEKLLARNHQMRRERIPKTYG